MREYKSEEKEMTITLSNMTKNTFENFLRVFELTMEEGDEIDAQATQFTPFNWNGRDEDDVEAMTEVTNHLSTQLSNFGVQFGRGGYKLIDVHTDHTILNIQDSRFKLRGGTDLVIVPFKTAKRGAASELCVLFELKTDVAIDTTTHSYQAVAELIAARYNSYQPNVLVVLTDANSTASIYELVHNGDADFKIVVSDDLTLAQMATKVCRFLSTSTVARSDYKPSADLTTATEFERGVLAFRSNKIQRLSNLSFEHLQDMMMDPTDWSQSEKAHLFANFFASVEQPMPLSVQYMMYS